MDKNNLKQLIDKPLSTHGFKVLDKMVTELGPYMNVFEVDQCIDFMYQIENSKYDVNWSISDAKTQLKIILGSDRFDQIVDQWKKDNHKLMTVFGTMKYKRKKDGSIWDGLDKEDNPNDYEKIYV